MNAIPLVAIERVEIYEPEIEFNHCKASRTKIYRFELIMKEDFLNVYLDPYFEIAYNRDKT